MPPSPVKRYRSKSRLRRGDAGADLRQKALEMAQKGLNRRGGPVDQGPPAEQKAAADRLKNERAQRLGEMEREKQTQGRAPQSDQVVRQRGGVLRRMPKAQPRASLPMLRRPAASRETGPTAGSYNRTKPASRGSEDLANQLAAQRATQNRPKARRKLFARG